MRRTCGPNRAMDDTAAVTLDFGEPSAYRSDLRSALRGLVRRAPRRAPVDRTRMDWAVGPSRSSWYGRTRGTCHE